MDKVSECTKEVKITITQEMFDNHQKCINGAGIACTECGLALSNGKCLANCGLEEVKERK